MLRCKVAKHVHWWYAYCKLIRISTVFVQIMQIAGIEDEQCVLLLEDHQFVEGNFLELVNSLLSAGEVPGLYTPEEFEPILAPLRDQASEAGFRGTLAQYFASSKYEMNTNRVFLLQMYSYMMI